MNLMKPLQLLLLTLLLCVYKRGRNAKAITRAKNASMGDYRRATGFEAVMGYLYLTEQSERMMELIKMAVSRFKNNEGNKRG